MEDRDGATVTELRLRLYRPDPPIGAVDAYLLALAAVTPPPAPVAPPRSQRHPAWSTALALVLVASAALGVARVAEASTPAAVPRPAASGIGFPEVPGYPLGRLEGGRAASGDFLANGARVVVSVYCSGNGVVTLRIADESPTELTCEPGGPALAMLESSAALEHFRIAVTAQPGVRWSLSAGELAQPQT